MLSGELAIRLAIRLAIAGITLTTAELNALMLVVLDKVFRWGTVTRRIIHAAAGFSKSTY